MFPSSLHLESLANGEPPAQLPQLCYQITCQELLSGSKDKTLFSLHPPAEGAAFGLPPDSGVLQLPPPAVPSRALQGVTASANVMSMV